MQPLWDSLRQRYRIVKLIRSWRDLWLFLRLMVFAAWVPVMMRRDLPAIARWLVPVKPTPALDPELCDKIVRFTDAALYFGRPITQTTCMPRGVTLYYFLSRAGLDVSLHFGAGEVAGQFAAHCWLMHNDKPFAESADPYTYYATTYVIPSPRSAAPNQKLATGH